MSPEEFGELYPYCYRAFQYVEAVESGQLLVCHKVKQTIARFRLDLIRSQEDFPFELDLDVAERYIEKCTKYPHYKGPLAKTGETFDPEHWQCFILLNIFGWLYKETGMRRFQEVFLEIARKNGKTFLAAVVLNVLTFEDGEFGAEGYCGATSLDQALEVFTPASTMAEKVHDGLQILTKIVKRPSDNSKMQVVIGDPKDGSGPHISIIDEYHEHKTVNMYETMLTGSVGREQPLLFVITTAGEDLSAPCYEHYQEMSEILRGAVKADNTFVMIFESDQEEWIDENGVKHAPDKWDSDEALIKANPNLGVSINFEALEVRRNKARNSAKAQNFYRTKHCNSWVGTAEAWLQINQWDACGHDMTLEDFRDHTIYLSIDLASFKDLTALGIVVSDADTPYVPLFALPFCCSKAVQGNKKYQEFVTDGLLNVTPGEALDYDVIFDYITEVLAPMFRIEAIVYDSWQSEYLATRLEQAGFRMYRFAQNYGNYSEAMRHFEGQVDKRTVAHPKNRVLDWCVQNVRQKIGPADQVMPTKDNPAQKIDLVVALLMAYAAFLKDFPTMTSRFDEEPDNEDE